MAYKPLRSPITLYGGKAGIISHMLPLVPPHDVYTEVFAGGLTLFFGKAPCKNETVNDLNDLVVNFYRVLQNDFKRLKKLIDSTVYSRSLHRLAWQMITNHCYSDVERAWGFWMRINFSFQNKLDGGLRFSNDQGSLPPVTMNYKKSEFTELLQKRIENAYIECDPDYMNILESRNAKNAFHELDPPYFYGPENAPADQGHYKRMFSVREFERLLKWCAKECQGKFMLHNYNSEFARPVC